MTSPVAAGNCTTVRSSCRAVRPAATVSNRLLRHLSFKFLGPEPGTRRSQCRRGAACQWALKTQFR